MSRRLMLRNASGGGGIDIPIGVNFYDQVTKKEGWYDQRGNFNGKDISNIYDAARTGARTVTWLMPYDTQAEFQAEGLVASGNVLAVLAFDENEICFAVADYDSIADIQSAIYSAEQAQGKKCKFVACTFNSANPVWMRIS